MLLSVVVIGVVFAGYTFVQPFKAGVGELGRDVKEVLTGQSIGGVGRGGTTGGTPTTGGPTTGPGTMNDRRISTGDTQAPNMGDSRDRRNPPDPRITNTVGNGTFGTYGNGGGNDA